MSEIHGERWEQFGKHVDILEVDIRIVSHFVKPKRNIKVQIKIYANY